MKKPRTWRIDNPVWDYNLFVRHGGSSTDATRWAERKLGGEFADIDGSVGICFAHDGQTNHAIWLSQKAGIGTLAHEALHSVAHIMHVKAMEPMSPANDEAYCYLLGWTVAEIGSRIWRTP